MGAENGHNVTLGTVKWFNVSNGYGFITSRDHGDIFVHANACPRGFLSAGEAVQFVIEPSSRTGGVQASDVRRSAASYNEPVVFSLAVQTPTFVC